MDSCWRVEYRLGVGDYNFVESSVTSAPTIEEAVAKVRKAEVDKKRDVFILKAEYLGKVIA